MGFKAKETGTRYYSITQHFSRSFFINSLLIRTIFGLISLIVTQEKGKMYLVLLFIHWVFVDFPLPSELYVNLYFTYLFWYRNC